MAESLISAVRDAIAAYEKGKPLALRAAMSRLAAAYSENRASQAERQRRSRANRAASE